MTTTSYPATFRELVEMAETRGIKASELLEELGPIPMPPAGCTLNPACDPSDYIGWDGPKFEGNGWKITSHWSIEEGVMFYVDGDGDNAIRGAEAGKIAAALAEVAALTA